MSTDFPVILNKVTSPHYVKPTLRRPRLLTWMYSHSDCRAIVVNADAGYGKTTLLWQFEQDAKFPCYWYKLDRGDRDWSFVITYLIESIRRRHEEFGSRAISVLRQMGGPGTSRPSVAAYLISEMHERLTEPCTFIIDDWQFVEGVTEVRGLWNQILRDAPPTCRFVFASRARPRLQFARFKTHGGFAQLGKDDLRFRDDEISQLFSQIYNNPLEPTELVELERRTEGWAASLQLVQVSLRERQTLQDRREFIQSITASTDSDLFAFLAEEVLDGQSEETRNFLLSTSILQQVTPELAERLAGVHEGARTLADLEERGLFTYRLDADAKRYRYHNLFRDFLERRLRADRGDSEVVGLHIHAASYFETEAQWPEAIHHYLKAGLQRQAARLIARHGEDVVGEGRVGTVDEWLNELPHKAIHENARLSLLYGEARKMRGDWNAALSALEHARSYFARKGDARFEALACLKLSSTYYDMGDFDASGATAKEGLAIVPNDDALTRLRLTGNDALVSANGDGELESAARTSMKLATQAAELGLVHYAALGHHNLGVMQRSLGLLHESAENLIRASRFWDELRPRSPHSDYSDLVETLLAMGRLSEAGRHADIGISSTKDWPLPHTVALFGRASVEFQRGAFQSAIDILRSFLDTNNDLGQTTGAALLLLFDSLRASNASASELADVVSALWRARLDARRAALARVARGRLEHDLNACGDVCAGREAADSWLMEHGFRLEGTKAKVEIAGLRLHHGGEEAIRQARLALQQAHRLGVIPYLRWSFREYAPHLPVLVEKADDVGPVEDLVAVDPSHWRQPSVAALAKARGDPRRALLKIVISHADRETPASLREIRGADVARARQALMHSQAPRIYAQTFGALRLRRGGWSGREILVEKKRLRSLLGLLCAHLGRPLVRDVVLDTLWPDAAPGAALNSLNQSVFQLRHLVDPDYRDGDSPQYIVSTADTIYLDDGLVRTDLAEIRRKAAALSDEAATDADAVRDILRLIDGEYLDELRYDEWVEPIRVTVHAEVRQVLLAVANGPTARLHPELALSAGSKLTVLDPYDEDGHTAVARALLLMGRARAANDVVRSFAGKLASELDERPSEQFLALTTQGLNAVG